LKLSSDDVLTVERLSRRHLKYHVKYNLMIATYDDIDKEDKFKNDKAVSEK